MAPMAASHATVTPAVHSANAVIARACVCVRRAWPGTGVMNATQVTLASGEQDASRAHVTITPPIATIRQASV